MVNTIETEEGSYVSGNEVLARFGPKKTPISARCVEALGFGFKAPGLGLRGTGQQDRDLPTMSAQFPQSTYSRVEVSELRVWGVILELRVYGWGLRAARDQDQGFG